MKNISVFFKDSKPLAQLVGLFFLFLVGFIIAGGMQMLLPFAGDTPSSIRGQLAIQGCSQILMFLLPAVLFAVIFHDGAISFYKVFTDGKSWLLGLIAVVMFLLFLPLNDFLTWWNGSWNLGAWDQPLRSMSGDATRVVERLLSLTSVGDLLLQLLVVALIPAVCEELFFRGALQQTLHRWFGNPHVAILVTALFFSLAHGDIFGLVPRFLLGMMLGYLFFLSGSMVVNICAHFFNNAMVVVMFYFYHTGVISQPPTEPMLLPWGMVLMCTLAASLLFAVYFLKKKPKRHTK